jgi:hypothetical protein
MSKPQRYSLNWDDEGLHGLIEDPKGIYYIVAEIAPILESQAAEIKEQADRLKKIDIRFPEDINDPNSKTMDLHEWQAKLQMELGWARLKLVNIERARIAMIKRVAELEDEGSPDQAWHELMEYINGEADERRTD